MTISSPLEAHKPNTICFSLCGVDVDYDNPIFAAIEVDYEDDTNKKVFFINYILFFTIHSFIFHILGFIILRT